MGELEERRWAVVSERGCEALSLKHAEAVELMHRLAGQKVYGTCVVTDAAARHLAPVKAFEPAAAQEPSKTHSKP
ncbi:MAG TPA: hypothetical protein VF553_12980 [Pyrinomonadaceae bacterium]|jgi:hypothetical protein